MKTAHKKNKRGKKDQLKRTHTHTHTHTHTQNRPIKKKKSASTKQTSKEEKVKNKYITK